MSSDSHYLVGSEKLAAIIRDRREQRERNFARAEVLPDFFVYAKSLIGAKVTQGKNLLQVHIDDCEEYGVVYKSIERLLRLKFTDFSISQPSEFIVQVYAPNESLRMAMASYIERTISGANTRIKIIKETAAQESQRKNRIAEALESQAVAEAKDKELFAIRRLFRGKKSCAGETYYRDEYEALISIFSGGSELIKDEMRKWFSGLNVATLEHGSITEIKLTNPEDNFFITAAKDEEQGLWKIASKFREFLGIAFAGAIRDKSHGIIITQGMASSISIYCDGPNKQMASSMALFFESFKILNKSEQLTFYLEARGRF